MERSHYPPLTAEGSLTDMQQSSHPTTTPHTRHAGHAMRNAAILGGATVAGGLILSPYILPAVGIGDQLLAEKTINALCGTGQGTGLAGSINALLEQVPVIGDGLAQGGWPNVATVATVGLGGHLLANKLDNNENKSSFPWGKIVRYTALATTMLVALPSVLTGISAGLVYLAGATGGVEMASHVLTAVSDTIGATGEASHLATSGLGLTATAAHLMTCGMVLAPATLPWLIEGRHTRQTQEHAPPQLNVTAEHPIVPGQPNTLLVRLSDAGGQPITPQQLAMVHEKKIHLFVANESLSEYHHIHPEPTPEPGVYAVPFTPGSREHHRVWAEVTPLATMEEHLVRDALPVSSPTASRFDFRLNRQATGQGLAFEWSASPPLRQGQTSTVTLSVTDNEGKPVTLLPHLGAMAHLAGFTPDDRHFIHTHAEEIPQPQSGPLHIKVTPPQDGPLRFFVEVNHGGQIATASFDQSVYPAKQHATEIAAQPQPQPSASHAR